MKIDHNWNFLLQERESPLFEFVQIAAKDQALNKLFPYTSLYTLCFSRRADFPFDTDELPNVTPIQYVHFMIPRNSSEYAKIKSNTTGASKQIYIVTKNKNSYIGEGDANEALHIIGEYFSAGKGYH